ncbi:histidine phosphatase family protein [Herbaspirillum sp. LeCh32-8]|uniref:histidine phosphatase family protein n=1 Tax=Herbaspirillum sp. LeCh32-8 TaxID=2821356 RepID=UPI001AE9463A|nr:histidine phosphatase family protein [Herbaspirillum sp. LeCh32-8]MBP0596871.1 histidine phosphatase family protein [Herbaspirillum sp. LeCh32-8]
MKLHLVRHPQPILDKSYCYGSSDVAVAAETLELCSELVASQLPRGVPICSSPLQRCADLALALAQALGVESIALDSGLQEMHFGSWELRAWDDIAWAEVEAWNRDLAHHAPGGGETLVNVAQRVWEVFDELCLARVSDTIVVCHGGSIRMLRACAAWQAEHGAGAAPDATAFEAIALRAAADRRDIGFGEVLLLEVAEAAQLAG